MKLSAILRCLGAVLAAVNSSEGKAAPPRDTVVLLHGMGRSHLSMTRLAWELDRDGYRVINATYPSRTVPLETLAAEWLPARLAAVETGSRVHFVTHSMGGILLRVWLRESAARGTVTVQLGRVVMLAPPNSGSEIPDRMAAFPPFHWWTGVNGGRLGTAADALPRALGPWPAGETDGAGALGVIAGSWSLPVSLSAWLPTPNDGKVSVASTHLAGERDHLVLPFSHTWLGWRRETLRQVKSFLLSGQFAQSRG